MVTVGSTVVASKVIVASVPPFSATCLRLAFCLPIFLLLMRFAGERLPRPDRQDRLLLLAQAGLGTVGYPVLLLFGLRWTSAADAGVVMGSLTAMVALVSVILLGERLRRSQVMTIALASAGVTAVTAGGAAEGLRVDPSALLGNAIVLCAVTCEASFLILNKRLRVAVPPLALSTVMTGLGALLTLPLALLEQPWALVVPAEAWLAMLWYALVPTVGGLFLWYAGAARLAGSDAALTTSILPVAAVAMAALVLGEHVGAAQLVGMACVLAAVLAGAAWDRR